MAWIDLTRILFALIAVLGLIGLCAFFAKRFGMISDSLLARKPKRIHLVETLGLDAKRRVAIIKCDDREYLVLLGTQGETVLDQNIPTQYAIIPDAGIDTSVQAQPDTQTPQHKSTNPFTEILTGQIRKLNPYSINEQPNSETNKAA